MRITYRHYRCSVWLIAVVAYWSREPAVFAQPVSIGLKGGVHLIDWYQVPHAGPGGEGTNESSAGIVGPFVRLNLPFRLALQAEGLRRSCGFTRGSGRVGYSVFAREEGSAWELPLLVVYRAPFARGGWQPFVNAGPALRYVTTNWLSFMRIPPLFPDQPPASETLTTGHREETKAGVASGWGVERRLGPVILSAEFRYARWSVTRRISDVRANQNQVEFLFGVRTGGVGQ